MMSTSRQTKNLIVLFFIILINLVTGFIDDRPERVNKLFEKYDKKGSPGLTVSIIQNGKFVHQNSFGLSDIRNVVKNNKKTRYFIASISKQFSCLGMALLELEGKVSVSKPIKEYLPEFRFSNITILQLMQHTSGLRDYLILAVLRGEGGLYSFTRDHAFDLLKKQKDLNFKSGESWDYSNSGYLLMEYIIERITKMKFSEYMKKKVFEPLGMKNTFFIEKSTTIIKNGAYGYVYGPNNDVLYAPLLSENAGAAGGIIMDHGDFLKYDRNFYDNKLPGGQILMDLIVTPGKYNNGTSHTYGWGLMMTKMFGKKIITHSK